MLRAEHLTVAYGSHRALEDISVRVDRGEICVILGANGAGKSTLLKVIAGVLHPHRGEHIAIGDNIIGGMAPNRIVEAGVALVPEGRGIFADLTVAENLELGAYGRQARARRDERLAEVLRLFPKLAERRGQVVRTMSGGEQQMVAIGRALMSNPKILMLDEPSLGLSPILCAELFKSLKHIQDTGTGILLVEQNARLSLAIADRAYLLENGHIKGEGRAAALANDPAVQKAYLGGVASSVHRRFGEPETGAALPLAPQPAPRDTTATGLAERASQIQRAHIENLRHGTAGMNGHAVTFVAPVSQTMEPIVVSSQANDLSRKAAEMASRASSILAAHVAATRQAAVELTAEAAAPDRKAKKDKASRKEKKAKKGRK